MRYLKEHKLTSRKRILFNALKLFSHRGFDNVSIDEVMADSGLTRGAFYAHFKNKQELYSEAILSSGFNDRDKVDDLIDGVSLLKQLVSDYLEADYSDPDLIPCPLAYLVTDVANRKTEVRSAYSKSFISLNLKIKKLASINGSLIDDGAIFALTSMMIGSVAVARTLASPEREQVLSGCKKIAFELIENV